MRGARLRGGRLACALGCALLAAVATVGLLVQPAGAARDGAPRPTPLISVPVVPVRLTVGTLHLRLNLPIPVLGGPRNSPSATPTARPSGTRTPAPPPPSRAPRPRPSSASQVVPLADGPANRPVQQPRPPRRTPTATASTPTTPRKRTGSASSIFPPLAPFQSPVVLLISLVSLCALGVGSVVALASRRRER